MVHVSGQLGKKDQSGEVQVGERGFIKKVFGNLNGLGAEAVRRIEQIYRRRVPPDRVVTHELARQLTELSREINRQIGLLVSRRGDVEYVIVGSHQQIFIPTLEGFRSSSSRFRGLRLIHTHLNREKLTDDDLTDLALLRLDLACAVEADDDGMPSVAHMAHLVPENQQGIFWQFLPPARPADISLNFTTFITTLETEFSRSQKTRKVDATDRAFLIRVETHSSVAGGKALSELRQLAQSCGVAVFDSVVQSRAQTDPKYVMGKGKLAEVVIRALQMGANLLVFDHELSPAQVRFIADFTELKVIDRTQLILDIFAQRAHSREGKIQVELAQLKYLMPRLATKHTAMSRLTGGIGARGPGETKLEINRRRIRDRIHALEHQMKDIEKARAQRRMKRERKQLPVISIVGYTNAGKSTLLNTLTEGSVFTEDRLFATLDPKSSRLRFPKDTEAIITDTVGFIRDLPKDLFAAFRATLDELQDADLLIHVVDVSDPDFEDHIGAVEEILDELDIRKKPTLLVFNKADRILDESALVPLCVRFQAVAISALDRKSLPPLVEKMEGLLNHA